MTGDLRSGLRVLRGVALAALSTLITALGHLAGGGTLPDLALLVVLFPLFAWMLVTVTDRCTSITGAVITLAAGQLVLHYLMVALHPSTTVGSASFGPSGMVTMHAMATVVTAIMVRGADRAALALIAMLSRVVPGRLTVPAVTAPLPTMVLPEPGIAQQLVHACTAPVVRRGPPVGC